MNRADTAAVFLTSAQRISSSKGVKKIPPPVPVNPDKKPRTPPSTMAKGFDGSWVTSVAIFGIKKRVAENNKTIPTMILKRCVDKLIYPPQKANGEDRIVKGQKSLHEKCPARQNCMEPMVATRIFRISAIGLISAGARLNRVIIAMYPEAPACPTEE